MFSTKMTRVFQAAPVKIQPATLLSKLTLPIPISENLLGDLYF